MGSDADTGMVSVSREDLREKITAALDAHDERWAGDGPGYEPMDMAYHRLAADAVLAVLDAPSEPPEYEQVGTMDVEGVLDPYPPQASDVPVYRRVAPSEPEGPPSPTPSLPDPPPVRKDPKDPDYRPDRTSGIKQSDSSQQRLPRLRTIAALRRYNVGPEWTRAEVVDLSKEADTLARQRDEAIRLLMQTHWLDQPGVDTFSVHPDCPSCRFLAAHPVAASRPDVVPRGADTVSTERTCAHCAHQRDVHGAYRAANGGPRCNNARGCDCPGFRPLPAPPVPEEPR